MSAQTSSTNSCDVVVVGAGPAGSAAAGYLAKHGYSVRILESEHFPRFHIGESLLPLGEYVFDELGCRDKVHSAGFHKKRGAQLRSPCGEHKVVFDFKENRIEPFETVQVHRAEFDQLLLDHATSLGAQVVVARARSYACDVEGVTVTYGARDEEPQQLRARVLIDASGRAGFVAKREGIRRPDDELKKASVYAHFRNVKRDEGERHGDTRIVTLPNLGWMWWIPLTEDLTSVGIVVDLAEYKQKDKGDLAALFDEVVQAAPLAAELLENAERTTDFLAESGFSYSTERYCGDRWFLAGDAGSFLDPVWSTGVQMALQAGLESAQAAIQGYLSGALRPKAGERYERTQRRRYQFVRRFVTGFYDPAMRDLMFSPRPYLGIHRAVTKVLAGGFDLGWLDRLRLKLFFLLARLQARYELVPRMHEVESRAGEEQPGDARNAVTGGDAAAMDRV